MRKAFILILMLIIPSCAWAAYDDVKLGVEEIAFKTQYRWENLTTYSAYWLSGYDNFKMHHGFVQLMPGEEVKIRLNRQSLLRLNSKYDNLFTPEMFNIQVSNGSGLNYSTKLQATNSSRDLLLAADYFSRIITISLHESITEPMWVGFFASYYEDIPDYAQYPTDVYTQHVGTKLCTLQTEKGTDIACNQAYKILPQEGGEFNIIGPARVEIKSRYIYNYYDAIWDFPYRIKLELDGNFIEEANYIARPDAYHNLFNGDFLSLEDSHYIYVPKGEHKLRLRPDMPIYAQLHVMTDGDYLLHKLNNIPNALEEQWRQSATKKDLNNRLLPTEVEEYLFKMAQDNSDTPAGLQATAIANDIWQMQPDDQSLYNFKNALQNTFTFFRDVLPDNDNTAKHLALDWVPNASIADLDDKGRLYTVADNQVNNLLEDLIQGYFVETETDAQHKLNYVLPERNVDSELRLVLQHMYKNGVQHFYVQFDEKAPILLTLHSHRELDRYAYYPDKGLIGLSILEKHLPISELKFATLGGAFGQKRHPGQLRSAGVTILPLPKEVRKISIWARHKKSPIKIAMQYRADQNFQQTPLLMAANVEKISKYIQPWLLFVHAMRYFDNCISQKNCIPNPQGFIDYLHNNMLLDKHLLADGKAFREVFNHWLDTLRLLYSRYQTFIADIGNEDKRFIHSLGARSESFYYKDFAKIDQAMAQQNWVQAINLLANIIENGDQKSWRQAHLRMLVCLQNNGESFLAERIMRTILFNTQDHILQNQIFDRLVELYGKIPKHGLLAGLLTGYLIRIDADEMQIKRLLDVLQLDGEFNAVINLVGLLTNVLPSKENLYLAMQEDAWPSITIVGSASKRLAKEALHFWAAQELQQQGKYEEALAKFKLSNKGAAWAKHLQQAFSIRAKFESKIESEKHTALNDWVKWYSQHPGFKYWQKAPYTVKQFYQNYTVYNQARAAYQNFFVARNKKPVVMKVQGPANVRLRLRAVLDKKNLGMENGFVVLKYASERKVIRLNTTFMQNVLHIIGHEQSILGTETVYEFSVPAGQHNITLESDTSLPILVDPYLERPLLALTVLPPVTPETMAFINSRLVDAPKSAQNCCAAKKEQEDSLAFYLVEAKRDCNGNSTNQYSNLFSQTVPLKTLPIDHQVVAPLPSANPQTYLAKHDKPKTHAEDLVAELLLSYIKTPNKKLLVKLGKLCFDNAGNYNIDNLCKIMSSYSDWYRILSVTNDAPIATVKDADTSEDITISMRQQLMQDNVQDVLIHGNYAAILSLTNSKAVRINIKAKLMMLPSNNDEPVRLHYSINDQEPQYLEISAVKTEAIGQINLERGEHFVRFFLPKDMQDNYVNLELTEYDNEKAHWLPLKLQNNYKSAFITTPNKPIELKVTAPAWISVHTVSADDAVVNVQNYFVETGEKTIKIAHQNAETVYRIFTKLPLPRRKDDINLQEQLLSLKVPTFSVMQAYVPPYDKKIDYSRLYDDLDIHANGTWTVWGKLAKASTDIGSVTKHVLVRYTEEGIGYRYFDDVHRAYYSSELLARQFQNNHPSFGAKLHMDLMPLQAPFTLYTEGRSFAQHANEGWNYSLYGKVGMRNTVYFADKFSNKIEIAGIWQKMHLKPAQLALGQSSDEAFPDPDVYNHYDANQYRALSISSKITYKPFLDTSLWGSVEYLSSPKKITNADRYSIAVGVDQLISPFVIRFDYTLAKYFKNQTRKIIYHQHRFNGNIIWDYWLKHQNQRLEIDFTAGFIKNNKLPTNTSKQTYAAIVSMNLALHFSSKGNYRDFKPSIIPFLNHKKKLIPHLNIMRKNAER